jgi:hypothetical protein
MKNKKCALGLVAVLAAVAGLTACDQVSSSDSGSIFTYTNANGVRTSYTADMLLANYRKSGSSLSTEFDKVYEVLVRNYYNNTELANTLAELKGKATQDVMTDKNNAVTNAKTNSTTYETELEKIMTTAGVKNADELYQYHLYQEEKTKFEDDIYQTSGIFNRAKSDTKSGLDLMKDGSYSDGTKLFASTADTWGISNDGWMLQQMPYHVRHILVKFANGKTGEFTQDKIGESTDTTGGETTKLAQTIMDLAGANYVNATASDRSEGKSEVTATSNRSTFGAVAQLRSDDGSASSYGDVGFFTKTTSFNNEFKLGTYAYESLYNNRESATSYGSSNVYRITPGLTEDATSTANVDQNQTVDTPTGSTSIHDYFKNFEYNVTANSTTTGIGQIPFGAAVALLDYRAVTKDSGGNVVNEGNEAFYPRNVLFNKYFNKHNVCVITPNAIYANKNAVNGTTAIAAASMADTVNGSTISEQNFVGTPVSEYSSLPGFQHNTTNILPQFTNNVLTDESGNVVLAVRTSTSSYQAMHLMIVQRSGLSQYGLTTDASGNVVEETAQDKSIPTLSQYYSTVNPGDTGYPTDASGNNLTTYVNFNKQTTSAYSERSKAITSDIKSYNSSLSTYLFQKLCEYGSITFANNTQASAMKDEIMTYSRTKRQSDTDTAFTSWKDAWKTYAEVLSAQEEARTRGISNGLGSLIAETAVVDFTNNAKNTTTGVWAKGGACYYGTK